MTPQITAVDHFAGVGWGVAARRLGVREYGAEIARSVIRIRSANRMRTIYRDVWAGLFDPLLVPAHRLYIASPPCQTFSIAGSGDGRAALNDVLQAIDEERWKDEGFGIVSVSKDPDEIVDCVCTDPVDDMRVRELVVDALPHCESHRKIRQRKHSQLAEDEQELRHGGSDCEPVQERVEVVAVVLGHLGASRRDPHGQRVGICSMREGSGILIAATGAACPAPCGESGGSRG